MVDDPEGVFPLLPALGGCVMDREKRIPTGRLGRLARLAKVGVQTGAGRILRRDAKNTSSAAADALGTLRGLATKLGQMSAYVDGLVPLEHRDAYEKGMKSLLTATPRSSSAEIQQLVEDELGAPIDELFLEWDEHPIASASIGQVHRARLHDGREVAVKVQHPGIVEAMESDLSNMNILESAVSLFGGNRIGAADFFEVVRQRFREELDYRHEATYQEKFRAIHEGDPHIRIPAVVPDRSTSRVLTSEFVKGMTYDDACRAHEADRRAWCETLWRFVHKGTILGGMFNADPHPGNYIFQPDGCVAFLDFGCIQPIEENKRPWQKGIHLAALRGDEDAFKDAARKLLDLAGGGHERRSLIHIRMMYDPLFSSPFRITRDYSAALLKQFKDFGAEARASKEKDYVALPQGFLFMNRLQFGFYSVLARLDVEVDYAAVERAFLNLD